MKADLYLITYVISNLRFKAIKIKEANQLPQIYWTIDRWFHLQEQEQDRCYQGYGLWQKKPSKIRQLNRRSPKSRLKILPSKISVFWKQARMVECGSLRELNHGRMENYLCMIMAEEL